LSANSRIAIFSMRSRVFEASCCRRVAGAAGISAESALADDDGFLLGMDSVEWLGGRQSIHIDDVRDGTPSDVIGETAA
jgi:hypothetical protein